MKRVIRCDSSSTSYKVGRFTSPGVDAVLEYIGFKFLPEDPDIAMMFDPADGTAIDVYDAKDGSIKRYEGANIDRTGKAFVSAMKDFKSLQTFLSENDVHVVETDFENLLF